MPTALLPPTPTETTQPATHGSEDMAAFRAAQFRERVRTRLAQTQGEPVEQTAQAIAADNHALAAAIMDPAFIEAAQKAYLDLQTQSNLDPRFQTKPELLSDYMTQFLTRRAAEATANAERVATPDFLASVNIQAQTPVLRDVKYKEVLDDLLNADEKGAPQVIVHVESTAKGMLIEHDALAKLFDPNGPLHIPLMAALQKQLPAAHNDYIHQMTLTWLNDRKEAAALTVEMAGPDGAARLEAQRQSKAFHEASQTQTAAAATPQPTVTGPIEAQKRAKADVLSI